MGSGDGAGADEGVVEEGGGRRRGAVEEGAGGGELTEGGVGEDEGGAGGVVEGEGGGDDGEGVGALHLRGGDRGVDCRFDRSSDGGDDGRCGAMHGKT